MKTKILILVFVQAFLLQLVGQNNQYVLDNKMEEIQLHTDRDVYITGEDIWFRADYRMIGEQISDEISKSLYIELITPMGESVASYKYPIVNGTVSGKYAIPDGLLTATYLLRAYTQFQRNYAHEHFVTNLIMIINPSVPLIGYQNDLNWKMKVYTGGNGIVIGKKQKVAFRVHPKIISNVVTLKIVDQFKDNVAEVELYTNGVGISEFLVKDSTEYRVTAYLKKGDSISEVIPKVKSPANLEYEFLNTSVRIKLTIPQNIEEKDYVVNFYDGYLVSHLEKQIEANDEWITVELNEDLLNANIKYLVVKDVDGKVLNVDADYQLPEKPEQIMVTTSEDKYKTRSVINISIEPLYNKFESYIVAVVKDGAFVNKRKNLPDFILENPQLMSSYLNNKMSDDAEFQDQLKAAFLIYENILASNPSLFKNQAEDGAESYWAPETRGITIRGIVRDMVAVTPEPDCDVYIAVIGKEPQLHVFKTNKKGEFIITLKHVSGVQNIFLCVDSKKENSLEILVNNDFVNKFDAFYATPTILDTSTRRFIEDIYINAQITEYTGIHDTIKFVSKPYKPIRFPEPSASILLDDYIALPTLREVINEIVPYVRVQKKKDIFSLEVFDPSTNQLYGDPLILIDNLPVFNVNELIQISPELIKRISVINNSYMYGEHLFRGIVFLETKTNNFAGIKLPESSTFLEFQALEDEMEFIVDENPIPNDESTRIPDFRNVLYWNPNVTNIQDGTTISFTSSDYEGQYDVIVRGITKDGYFGFGKAVFSVKDE